MAKEEHVRFLKFCILLLLTSSPAHAAPMRFAVIGDFGTDDANELAVSQLVITNLQPVFIVTTGDNQYDGADAYDRDVGKYYHSFIGNYTGSYGAGSPTNRFWPSLGNHDYLNDDYAAYKEFFTLPGNERYYDVVLGSVHLFVVNTDGHEPDGVTANSVQGRWLSNALTGSSSPWKVVALHHPPYSSAGSDADLQWPFKNWGAHVVLAGHAHHYERLEVDGFPYIVNGAGGASLAGGVSPGPGSKFIYDSDHGAMLGLADESSLELSFYSVAGGGTLVDSLRLAKTAPPRLTITRVHPATNQLAWPTNQPGFMLETTATMANPAWSQVAATPTISSTNFVLSLPASTAAAYYRLRRASAP